ncbi:unnamed protein product, partial [Heterosigma akashiwo]
GKLVQKVREVSLWGTNLREWERIGIAKGLGKSRIMRGKKELLQAVISSGTSLEQVPIRKSKSVLTSQMARSGPPKL